MTPDSDKVPAAGDPTRSRRRRLLNAAGALLLAWAVAVFLWGATLRPSPDYDELYLYSFVRGAVDHGQSFHAHFWKETPEPPDRITIHHPPLGLVPRICWQRLWGKGHAGTRILSVMEGLCLAALLALAMRKLGSPGWLVCTGAAALLADPSFTLTFRTMRFDQEPVFFGLAALLAPLLFLSRRTGPWLWPATGHLIGWAACMHPRGVVFAVLEVVALFACRSLWAARDGMGARRRALIVAAGAAIPVAFTAAWYLADPPGTRRFAEGMANVQRHMWAQNTTTFKDVYAWPGGEAWPDGVRASVNVLLMGAEPRGPSSVYGVAPAVRLLSWPALLVLSVAGAGVLARAILRREGDLWVPLLAGPALVVAVHMMRPPINNYLVYSESLAVIAWCGWTVIAGARRRFIAGSLAAYAAVHLIAGTIAAADPPPVTWGFDDDYDAQTAMSERLGLRLREASGPALYADLISYQAGGRRAWPAFEYFDFWPDTRLQPDRAWIFEADAHAALFRFAPATPELPTEPERKARLDAMAEGLRPAGVIFYEWPDAPSTVRQRHWFLPANLLQQRHLRGERDVTFMRGPERVDCVAIPEPGDRPSPLASDDGFEWSIRLPPGLYAFSVAAADAYRTTIIVECEGTRRLGRLIDVPQSYPANLVPLQVSASSVRVTASVRDFSDTKTGSAPSLHVWRLEPVSARGF